MKINKTNRGFELLEFSDKNGLKCNIQKSSVATEDCLWLGVEDANPLILASSAELFGVKTNHKTGWVEYPIPDAVLLSTRMHLTQKQAYRIAKHLIRFSKTGEL